MRKAIARIPLEPHFEIIIVPCGSPQTKPRALNYAMHFVRGSLVTIFDAEDIPDPNQLKDAAAKFAHLPKRVACLQAQLVHYNPAQNWLTRMFAVEYATLFAVILPALAANGLPFPLGGTSNHFRAEVLRSIGGWDPHNVTEDADIGLRLARAGFEMATLESRTHEEANSKLWNWMRQRTRWFKGFLQTWLVHMRRPVKFCAEVGPIAFWAMQTMTIGVFASALLHPLSLIAIVRFAIMDVHHANSISIPYVTIEGMNLSVLVLGYAVGILAGALGLARVYIHGWYFWLATIPLYWLLMSVAAWMAVWEFIVKPFHWNKTDHGHTHLPRII